MVKVFKIRKGLDIRLKGRAERTILKTELGDEVALCPDSFPGVTPKIVVREGDNVKAGDLLFINKQYPDIGFSSPVSGKVVSVVRGSRRKLLRVVVAPDKVQQYKDFGIKDPETCTAEDVVNMLVKAGLFGYINQLPYAVSTNTGTNPKGIFVSALRDKPLACDFEYELEGNEHDFQTGLTALSKISKTYLGIGREQCSECLRKAKDVDINIFDGPCPAGNVGVQINHIDPVNKGEVVWTVDPAAVIFFGRLFNTGKVDLRRLIAVAGSEVRRPTYAEVMVGQKVSTVLKDNISTENNVRIINGNVLTGKKCAYDDFLDAHASEVTVIPEGDKSDELFGWIMPRLNHFSVSGSYFSRFMKHKEFALDARVKGGNRNMIMSGEYDKVLPMDIYPEFLVKAVIVGDIDKMEALGIYEVSPEDFALPEFVDSSKLELQKIIREGLDMLRKENS